MQLIEKAVDLRGSQVLFDVRGEGTRVQAVRSGLEAAHRSARRGL